MRIVRPTHRGIIERFGKYRQFALPGFQRIKQANILAAEGEAEAIKLVNEADNTYFVSNAQLLRTLEAVEKSLRDNAKIVIPADAELVNVIGELAGMLPLSRKRRETSEG